MMLNIQRFVKRPIEVQAVQVTATNTTDLLHWLHRHGVWAAQDVYGDGLHMDTRDGGQHACVGDWIVQGLRGHWLRYKQDVFEEIYEFAGHVTDPETLTLDLGLPGEPDPDDGLDG